MISKNIYIVLFIGLFIKIVIGGLLPLSPDEAYYWIWSHHLQLSYFDHPPVISWLYLLGQPFESMLSFVRLPGILLGQLTIFLWVMLLRDYFSDKQLFTFATLSQLMPFLGPAGLIITPDTPMMFFWAACLLSLQWLLKTKNIYFALLLGISFGLGFCSKYPIILILPILFFWLWKSAGFNKTSLKWVSFGVCGALLSSFPVWYWNLTNDMQSFGFQLSHGFGGSFQLKYLYQYLLAQVGLLFPSILFFAWKSRKVAPEWLVLSGVFPIVFFAFSSLFSYAEVNWPIAAHPAILALACFSLADSRWKKFTAAIWAIVLTVVISEAFFSWIPSTGLRLKTHILHKYEAAAEKVHSISPVYARTYQMASMISFLNKSHIYKLKGMNRIDFFDSLKESLPVQREFYIILKINEALPKALQKNYTVLKREPIDNSFELAMVKGPGR